MAKMKRPAAKPIGKGRTAPISGGPLRAAKPRAIPPGTRSNILPRVGASPKPIGKGRDTPISGGPLRPPKPRAVPRTTGVPTMPRVGGQLPPMQQGKPDRPVRGMPVGRAVPRTTGVPTMPRVGAAPRLGSPANKGFRGPRGM